VRVTIPRNRPSFRGRHQPEPGIQILAKKDWIPGSRCRAPRNDQLSGKNCNDLILRNLRSRRLEVWPHAPWPMQLIVSAPLRGTVTAGSSELQKTAYFSGLPRLTKRAGAGADRPRSLPIHRID
jgi:hypothetical protein